MPDRVPAITLWQPYATLWAAGRKRIETRSWPLKGRLPRTLFVHASKRFDREYRQLCLTEPFRSALLAVGYSGPEQLPLGAVVGIVTVVQVVRQDGTRPPEPEGSFGIYRAGRYAWASEDNRLLPEPIPASGAQLVWHWTPPAAGLAFTDRIVCPPHPTAEPTLF